MERTKHNPVIQNNAKELLNRLTVLSEISNRMGLARAMMGQTYNGDRDIASALGYPTALTFADYFARYRFQDIAKAIIDIPADDTWRGDVIVEESKDDKETDLEKSWLELSDNLKLKSVFCRLDKLTGIGKYGILLLGFNDTRTMEVYAQPINKSIGATKEGAPGLKLVYVKPFSEGSVKVAEYVTEPADKRYGLPKLYDITFQESGSSNSQTVKVHYSRVIHVVDDILESEIEGHPRMESVFYRLIDLEKIIGGDGEMFWRGARPGYANVVDKEFSMSPTDLAKLQEQVEEYEHNLRRFITVQGVDVKSLAQQLADPKNHVDIQIQMISAKTRIPKRMLTGSERGELSSSQDSDEWKSNVQARRDEYAELRILRPFIDRLIELGILPKPSTGRYSVRWTDLFAMSAKDKTEIGKNRATALKDYSTNPEARSIVPIRAFMTYFLGMDDEEIEITLEMLDEEMKSEPPLSEEEMETVKQAGEDTNQQE